MRSMFYGIGYGLSAGDSFRLIREAGFDGTFVPWGDEYGEGCRALPDLAREAGLFVESAHTPYGTIDDLWRDTADGVALADSFLRYVTDCAEREIPAMVMHITSTGDPPPFNELGFERFLRIVDKAEKYGVNVAVENIRHNDYIRTVFGRVDSQRVGLCFDSGHRNCWTPRDDPAVEFGSRLMCLHLHDNDGTYDRHQLPFDGNVDWASAMKSIAASSYRGGVSLEAGSYGYENKSPEEFLRITLERVKRLENLMSP